MVYRLPHAAPESQLPPERRGRRLGRYCLVCASIYPLHGSRHSGRPLYGRDHIASTCAHEGEPFGETVPWWEFAVAVLPEAAAVPPTATRIAGSPRHGTEPAAVDATT